MVENVHRAVQCGWLVPKLTGMCGGGRMFDVVRGVFSMLDNSGPIARTMAAPYPIIDCEKMSASGLTCNSVRTQRASDPPAQQAPLVPERCPHTPWQFAPNASRSVHCTRRSCSGLP